MDPLENKTESKKSSFIKSIKTFLKCYLPFTKIDSIEKANIVINVAWITALTILLLVILLVFLLKDALKIFSIDELFSKYNSSLLTLTIISLLNFIFFVCLTTGIFIKNWYCAALILFCYGIRLGYFLNVNHILYDIFQLLIIYIFYKGLRGIFFYHNIQVGKVKFKLALVFFISLSIVLVNNYSFEKLIGSGFQLFYKDGILKLSAKYSKKNRDFFVKLYTRDSLKKIEIEGYYEDPVTEKSVALGKFYDEKERLKGTIELIENRGEKEGTYYDYYDTGEIKSEINVHFKNLKASLIEKKFRITGKLESESFYGYGKNKSILIKDYDANGKLFKETSYLNNKLDGICRHYYPDGTIKVEANYKNGLEVEKRKYFSEKGELIN